MKTDKLNLTSESIAASTAPTSTETSSGCTTILCDAGDVGESMVNDMVRELKKPKRKLSPKEKLKAWKEARAQKALAEQEQAENLAKTSAAALAKGIEKYSHEVSEINALEMLDVINFVITTSRIISTLDLRDHRKEFDFLGQVLLAIETLNDMKLRVEDDLDIDEEDLLEEIFDAERELLHLYKVVYNEPTEYELGEHEECCDEYECCDSEEEIFE